MKKSIYLYFSLALAFCAVSCQDADLDNNQNLGKELTITATIADPNASRVTLTDNGETLHPQWTVNDNVIGFDEAGNTFTFSVTEVVAGRATMSVVGEYTPVDGRKVYAIYAPGKSVSDISENQLTVNIASQEGLLDDNAPFLMCATATTEGSSINLVFENKVAAVGLKKFKVNPVAAATTVDHLLLDGAIAAGTFQIVTGKLELVPDGAPATITAAGSWETDATGLYDAPVYFAVLPTANANLELHAASGSDTYVNLASISQTTLEAGYYYRMSKILDAVADVNGTKYASIDAAWAAANAATSDVTVTLLANCTADATLTLNSSGSGAVALDLNGNTLTGPSSNYTLSISNSRSLTVCDNSTSNAIDQGAIIGVSAAHTLYAVSSTVDITGGTIKAPSGKAALWIQTSSSATMSGGKLDATSSNYRAAYVGSGSSLTISDGEIESQLQCIYSTGTTTITGGKFESKTTYPVYSVGTGNVSVSGGYFSSESESDELFNIAKSSGNTGVCSVSGGCFDRAINYNRSSPNINKSNTDAQTKDKYPFIVEAGTTYYQTQANNLNYYHAGIATAVIHANNSYYDITLSPFRACSPSSSIELTNKYGHLITLDLKGKTMTANVKAGSFIKTSGTLTITDSESSKGKITSNYTKIINQDTEGTINIDDCYIECTATSSNYYAEAVIYIDDENAKVNISNNARIYSTKALTAISNQAGTLIIENAEISSGTESTGLVAVANGLAGAQTVIHSGSFWTSSTTATRPVIYNDAGAANNTATAGTVTINGGFFYSTLERDVRSAFSTQNDKIIIKGGLFAHSTAWTVNPTYGIGKQEIDLGENQENQQYNDHATISQRLYYRYKVDEPSGEGAASLDEPVANYGGAQTGINF